MKLMNIKKEEVKNIDLSALSNPTPGSTFFTSSIPNIQQNSLPVKYFDVFLVMKLYSELLKI